MILSNLSQKLFGSGLFRPSGFSSKSGAATLDYVRRWKSKKSKKKRDPENCPDGTFSADEMELTLLLDENMQKKPSADTLTFGKSFTDYMFSVKWDKENGWTTPQIEPITQFKVHPGSKSLHYGVGVFEGMQAYRGYDGKIRLFRPDLNMKRLLVAAKRLCLPTFDPWELTECIKKLVKLEQDWIPDIEGGSLYIRPVYIGTEPSLRLTPPNSALLYVILCPVAKENLKSLSLYADSKYVRTWPGGCGHIKYGGNYAPQIYLHGKAEQNECQQVLWMQGKDHKLEDIGNMNIFFVIKNEEGEKELVTPPLNGQIINGVIRQSVIELCQEWKKFGVDERSISMDEFKSLLSEKRLKEVFGTGTSRIIMPVSSILYEGSKYDIPTTKQDKPLYSQIRTALTGIKYGKVDHKWGIRVDT